MKITTQTSSKATHRLIVINKDQAPTASFQKQLGIDKNSLTLATKTGDTTQVTKQGYQHIIAVKNNPKSITNTIATWVHNNLDILGKELALTITNDLSKATDSIVIGVLQGRYQVGLYKTKNNKDLAFLKSSAKIIVEGKNDSKVKAQINLAEQIFTAQKMAMDMVNAPGNKLKPSDLANYAKASGKELKYSVKVFSKKQIQAKKLDALLAVNRGSEWDPAFIIAEYKGKAKKGMKLPKIGLVGKGVTFDTGGISMKGPNNMQYMKSDMGGAAAALGTIDAAARLKLPVHLIAIVPSTDNCVDANAIKPGDVIGSYAGKTIEVTDTDAEGRLILADGLWYMQKHFKPEVMIDLATLTGSSVRTLGYQAAALFTNNNKLNNALIAAGEKTGERCWPLPLWDSYDSHLHSDVADVKNFSGRPVAGAISAAKFLEIFTNDHSAWAHLDIAGVAFGNSPLGKDKAGTGYGIRLLISYLQENFA